MAEWTVFETEPSVVDRRVADHVAWQLTDGGDLGGWRLELRVGDSRAVFSQPRLADLLLELGEVLSTDPKVLSAARKKARKRREQVNRGKG